MIFLHVLKSTYLSTAILYQNVFLVSIILFRNIHIKIDSFKFTVTVTSIVYQDPRRHNFSIEDSFA